MSVDGGCPRSKAGLVVAAVLGLSAAGACSPLQRSAVSPPSTTTLVYWPTMFAPGVDTVFIDSASHDSLVTIAEGQPFDSTFGVGDRQRLMIGALPGATSHGPLMRIQPHDSSFAADSSMLADGFVVARWINDDTMGYPKLGSSGRDTTYWFVDRLPAGTWRSRYVSSRYTGTIVVDTTLEIHPSGTTHTRSLARWIWLDSDESGWVTCTSTGCCTSGNAKAWIQDG